LICVVPVERIELPTFGLQNRCSTAELNRQTLVRDICPRGFVAFVPPKSMRRGRRAVKYQTWLPRATAESHTRKRTGARRMLHSTRESRSAGVKHGGQAAVGWYVWPGGVFCPGSNRGTEPGPRGGSRFLQALCPNSAGSGARRIGQPALRCRPSGHALVGGVSGSLRMVSRCFRCGRRRGKGCARTTSSCLHRLTIARGQG
jgi:hypothetical protein